MSEQGWKSYSQFVQDHGDPWTAWYRSPVSSKEQLLTANPEPHTCQHCSVIVTDLGLNSVRRDRIDICRQLNITNKAVAVGAANGCPLLRLLRKGFHQAITNAGINGLVRALEGGTNWELARMGILSREQAIVYLAECLGQHPFHLRILDELCLFSVLGWASDWFLITALPDSNHSLHFPAKPVQRDVWSRRSRETYLRWLNECLDDQNHSHCTPYEPSFTPTRLVEILDAGENPRLRLVEKQSGEQRPYCCLSYCWGGDQPFKTTQTNRRARLTALEFDDLPLTIQDAVRVTSSLGRSFLWVDSLCIIQDDEEDKVKELTSMAEVYINAVVTISAANAPDCRHGFLKDRSYMSNAHCQDLTLPVKSSNAVVEQLLLMQRFEPDEHPQEDPVNSRGWILQERILSPRILDFGTRQTRWYCSSMSRFDGGRTDDVVRRPKLRSLAASDDPQDYDGWKLSAEWMAVVAMYSRRLLSVSEDKLVALSAIAAVIGKRLQTAYLGGLWQDYLAFHLLWQVSGRAKLRPKYRAPSWSWACVDSGVSYSIDEFELSESKTSVQFISHGMDLGDERLPYGRVKSGYIELIGRVREGRWYKDEPFEIVLTDTERFPIPPLSDYMLELEDHHEAELVITSEKFGFFDEEWEEVERKDLRPGTIREVQLNRDAIEVDLADCWTEDYIEVWCLELLPQDSQHERGSRGLILISSRQRFSASAHRIGHFSFAPRKQSLFQENNSRTVTIV